MFCFARSGEPLYFVFISPRLEPEQISNPVEQIAERVRKIQFTDGCKLVCLGAEENSRTKVAGPIDTQDGCRLKRRGVVGGRGVCVMVLNNKDLAVREACANFELCSAFRPQRERPGDGNAVDIFCIQIRNFEGSLEGFIWKRAWPILARDFHLLHTTCDQAILRTQQVLSLSKPPRPTMTRATSKPFAVSGALADGQCRRTPQTRWGQRSGQSMRRDWH